jgi:hypothetical protein
VRVPDRALDDVHQHGYAIVEGFLAPDELKAAQEALWLHFPRPEDYFADPSRHPTYAESQFAGMLVFPYRSWDLNRLGFHPDLVDAAERFLDTTDIALYKIELWGKYSGAVSYDQPLHRDYGSHSMVVPRVDGRYRQLTTFVYLSDVTDDDAPTRLVPYEHGKDVPFTPLYIEYGRLAEHEVAATAPAGSLLLYRTDILHRGSDFNAPGRARFSILADYQARGPTWAGKISWPSRSPERGWTKALAQMSVRQRDLFGWPRPGDEYWNEQTLTDVAARYPGMDMTEYRDQAALADDPTMG